MSVSKLGKLEEILLKLRKEPVYHSIAEVNADLDEAIELLREYRHKGRTAGLILVQSGKEGGSSE